MTSESYAMWPISLPGRPQTLNASLACHERDTKGRPSMSSLTIASDGQSPHGKASGYSVKLPCTGQPPKRMSWQSAS